MPRAKEPDFEIKGTSGQFTARDMLATMKEVLQQWELSADGLENIEIAMAEALNNVVEHAYEYRDGFPMELTLSRDETGLRCVIIDHGATIPDCALPPGVLVDPGTALDDLPEGGFGWFLIRTLSDGIAYRRRAAENQLEIHFPLG